MPAGARRSSAAAPAKSISRISISAATCRRRRYRSGPIRAGRRQAPSRSRRPIVPAAGRLLPAARRLRSAATGLSRATVLRLSAAVRSPRRSMVPGIVVTPHRHLVISNAFRTAVARKARRNISRRRRFSNGSRTTGRRASNNPRRPRSLGRPHSRNRIRRRIGPRPPIPRRLPRSIRGEPVGAGLAGGWRGQPRPNTRLKIVSTCFM